MRNASELYFHYLGLLLRCCIYNTLFQYFVFFSVSFMNDIEQTRPISAAVHEPAVRSFPNCTAFQETEVTRLTSEKTHLSISTDEIPDNEMVKPDIGLFKEPAVTSFPPEKTHLSISTDKVPDNETVKPDPDLFKEPAVTIFPPEKTHLSISTDKVQDNESVKPDLGLFKVPAVIRLYPEKTHLSISTDTIPDKDTDPDLEIPSLILFGPGIIKPTHHVKGSAHDDTNPAQHSKTAKNENEKRKAESSDQSDVTVQSTPDTASSQSRQSESASLDGGDIGEVMLHLERKQEGSLTDIDV